ncbi:protein-tyrosine-phosphatase [Rhodopirellula sp. SWK7]|uniref:protein-tyrosine-phosphatase n=1 Tax=Rhodopirellula sp. SWK7 TaxID=595460 RepID=UPI0002BEDAC7|nr:protein-tyrosine-phosphatase [Rhodopirellula sp. SWK7]EMI40838.1 protein-tyrosine-phosphatase [Rhodopirellula sp. SWK7]
MEKPDGGPIYRNHEYVSVCSRGTSRAAVQTIRTGDITWADVILVMEERHRQRIGVCNPLEAMFKPMHGLEIPNEYRIMDGELVVWIRSASEQIFAAIAASS